MARKFTASKTHLRPDPRFGSKLAGKFINCVMHNGKKSVAQRHLLRRDGAGSEAAAQREPDRRLHPRGRERQAGDRGSLEASRRCHLPGADAGQQEPPADPVDPLAPDGRPREEGPAHGHQAGRRARRRVQPRRAPRSPAARTSTAWPTPTRRSPTSPGEPIDRPDVRSHLASIDRARLRRPPSVPALDSMAQDPLHVLWVEPTFPAGWGRWPTGWCGAGAIARRSTATRLEPRETWPASVGQGLDVQVFGVGGIARESAVTWSRALERSLCYAYGCWEVLEQKRPRPIDLIVGRSTGLGSSPVRAGVLARPRRWSTSSITTTTPTATTWPTRPGPRPPPAYFHWRRSMAAIELLDLEQAALGWTPTDWQRGLYPGRIPRRRSWSCTTASTPAGSPDRPWHAARHAARGRSPAG